MTIMILNKVALKNGTQFLNKCNIIMKLTWFLDAWLCLARDISWKDFWCSSSLGILKIITLIEALLRVLGVLQSSLRFLRVLYISLGFFTVP